MLRFLLKSACQTLDMESTPDVKLLFEGAAKTFDAND